MNKKCDDVNCPIHGKISVRGKLLEGKVIRKKALKTAIVEILGTRYLAKYERYLKTRNRYVVHCPDCLGITVGDTVVCGETRKLSKTKSFVVLKKVEDTTDKKPTTKAKAKKVVESKEDKE